MTSLLAYLTADLPGIAGRIKQSADDFAVEELPLYPASGQGEHVMLLLERRLMSTMDVVHRLAKAFRVNRGAVGYAGLKDKFAVTRQHFTIHLPGKEAQDEDSVARLADSPCRVLWWKRHHNKLRRGHLGGNRFDLRIRQVDAGADAVTRSVLDRLARDGVPNYFGGQRFGYRQNNHVLGALLLKEDWQGFLSALLGSGGQVDHGATQAGREAYDRGDYRAAVDLWPRVMRYERQALDALRQGRSAQQAVRAIDLQQREFLVSATQSAAFNAVLDRRLRGGLMSKLVEGDLAWKHDSRGVFSVDAALADVENSAAGRIAGHAISPTGPLWGVQMMRAGGVVAGWEDDALAQQGLTPEDLTHGPRGEVTGVRRPLRVFLTGAAVGSGADERGGYLRLQFELDRGSFATVVLREIMKNDDDAESRSAGDDEEAQEG